MLVCMIVVKGSVGWCVIFCVVRVVSVGEYIMQRWKVLQTKRIGPLPAGAFSARRLAASTPSSSDRRYENDLVFPPRLAKTSTPPSSAFPAPSGSSTQSSPQEVSHQAQLPPAAPHQKTDGKNAVNHTVHKFGGSGRT